jgi:glucosamine--fructose-6-phosphate aminotransferase (isomerizing)
MTTLLQHEISSQPELIAALLDAELAHIGQIAGQLPPYNYALVAARGSSDHAALYAKYAWGALAGLPVALAAPSLHTLYGAPPRLSGALVIGISQSGQSPDIVAVLDDARRQGRPTLAVTNDASSPLAGVADHVVELHAGPERSIAATKTYTAELTVLAALAAHWSGQPARLAELERIPERLQATLQQLDTIPARAERYRYMTQCVVIGRGYNYATAYELSLKLEELTYLMATAHSSADFRHGPIATVAEGMPVILIAPRGQTYLDMRSLAEELRQRAAELLVVSDDQEILALAQTPLPLVAEVPEWLSPITAILPGQALALHLTLAKGLHPDQPRGLRKVTRTF